MNTPIRGFKLAVIVGIAAGAAALLVILAGILLSLTRGEA
jgi:hypothetical protein